MLHHAWTDFAWLKAILHFRSTSLSNTRDSLFYSPIVSVCFCRRGCGLTASFSRFAAVSARLLLVLRCPLSQVSTPRSIPPFPPSHNCFYSSELSNWSMGWQLRAWPGSGTAGRWCTPSLPRPQTRKAIESTARLYFRQLTRPRQHARLHVCLEQSARRL